MNRLLSLSVLILFLYSCTTKEAPIVPGSDGIVLKINHTQLEMDAGKTVAWDNKDLQCRMFLVRHAEKDTVGNDPALTAKGQQRANHIADIFKELPFRRIYSTNYRRTLLTAKPTADAMHLPVQTYSPDSQNELLDQLGKLTDGGNYLIVGHSNTVPKMLNHLSGKSVYSNIPDKVYDRFFAASIYKDGRVEIMEMTYNP